MADAFKIPSSFKTVRDQASYLVGFPGFFALDQVNSVSHFFHSLPPETVAGVGGLFTVGVMMASQVAAPVLRRQRRYERLIKTLVASGDTAHVAAIRKELAVLEASRDYKQFDKQIAKVVAKYRQDQPSNTP